MWQVSLSASECGRSPPCFLIWLNLEDSTGKRQPSGEARIGIPPQRGIGGARALADARQQCGGEAWGGDGGALTHGGRGGAGGRGWGRSVQTFEPCDDSYRSHVFAAHAHRPRPTHDTTHTQSRTRVPHSAARCMHNTHTPPTLHLENPCSLIRVPNACGRVSQ